ncbi:MAG: carbohydrate binding family 9 domain-containing protein [Ignavibacteriae bacterium]|nr:carbohydrate binding family 9 domain-containing protein [Ignavibacteriota bacterium]
MNIPYCFILLTFFILSFLTINAQSGKTTSRPVFNIIKIEKPILINGKLDNPIWLQADPIEINYEISPGDNAPAKERTVVRALYDEENLYFGFQCFDSNPSEIRANFSERDKIFADDFVILIIDTYNDAQKGYELACNPFGIQGDLLATLNNEDSNFDINWKSVASINDSGWTAEMAIPLTSLAFDESDEPIWGINVVRTIPRESRTQYSWVPIDKDIPGFMSQSGLLKGLKNINSSAAIELLPYVIGQYNGGLADYDDPNSKFSFNPLEGRIGGGIKYSPSPNFSLDAVINPDFSQIESDADQISVNTTFALYYDEKRPFFLIGNELLQTPMYYSRSINDPLAAGRIIGKKGSLSYMYLGAYDRNTVFVVPGEEESSTAETNLKSFANIGKLRYDFGDEDYIGTLLMSRNMKDGHNYLVGFDWNYKFWENWFFNGEGFISQTKELNDSLLIESERKFGSTGRTAKLDGENYSGNGIHLVLSHSQKHYNFDIVSNHFSPTYQTYNGLFSSSGFREQFMSHSYIMYPDSSFLDRASFSLETQLQHNYDGIIKDLRLTPSINLNMKGQTYLYASYQIIHNEKYNGINFKGVNRAYIQLNSKPLKELSFNLYASFGKFIYRSDTPAIGNGHNLGASITLKPTANLNVEFSYDRARLSDKNTEELFYDGNIYRTVAIYQFNQEAFFRTIFQYNSFDKTFKIYPLFSYQLGAFTTFYAGATSNYQNYQNDFVILNTDQQYFIKLQYLIGL